MLAVMAGFAVPGFPETWGDEASPSPAKSSPGEAKHVLDLKAERAIVFKDGYALVIKRGVATTDEQGRVYTDEVPDAAILGSFWAVPTNGRLVSLVAGRDDRTEAETRERPATTVLEILEANQGRVAQIDLTEGRILQGTIRQVLTTPGEPRLVRDEDGGTGTVVRSGSDPFASLVAAGRQTGPSDAGRTTTTIREVTGTHFVLQTESGDVLVPVSDVKTVQSDGLKTTVSRSIETRRQGKRLTLTFDQPDQKCDVRLIYFRPGLRWIPAYRVDLPTDADIAKAGESGQKDADASSRAQSANLALQAELLNEAEDLIDCPIDLVVGVPNFRFREIVSPLVLEATLRRTLEQAAPQLMGQTGNLSNALMTQRSGELRSSQRAYGGEEPAMMALPPELTTGASQDLFVYHLPRLSMRRGERAAVPILTATVPVQTRHSWDVRIARQDIETAPSGSGIASPLVLANNSVWRNVLLTNRTGVPWTTGAAMLTEGNLPLAQELLTYTSLGDRVTVPVTVAVDVRGVYNERETDRRIGALSFDGYQYAQIIKQGTLTLTNRKPVPVTVDITVRLGGRATEASDEGAITLSPWEPSDWQNYRGSPAVNNHSEVRWTVTVPPGQTVERNVVSTYYIRS